MKAESYNKSCQTVLTADFVATCIAYCAVTDSVYSFQTILQYCFCQVITVYPWRNVGSLYSTRNDLYQLMVWFSFGVPGNILLHSLASLKKRIESCSTEQLTRIVLLCPTHCSHQLVMSRILSNSGIFPKFNWNLFPL